MAYRSPMGAWLIPQVVDIALLWPVIDPIGSIRQLLLVFDRSLR